MALVTPLWKVGLLVLMALGYAVGEQPTALGIVGVLCSASDDGCLLLHAE